MSGVRHSANENVATGCALGNLSKDHGIPAPLKDSQCTNMDNGSEIIEHSATNVNLNEINHRNVTNSSPLTNVTLSQLEICSRPSVFAFHEKGNPIIFKVVDVGITNFLK